VSESPALRSDQLLVVNGQERRPRVSVIVIFLNDHKFLSDAIQSVLRQTITDWELLLVDDGSTDGSTGVARRYAQDQPGCIRYLEHAGHANLGKSSARNLGLSHARGEYLLCLDSDDILLPQALEVLIGLLTRCPAAAMVYGPLEYWYSWTTPPYRQASDFVQRLGLPGDELIEPPNLLMAFLQRRAAVPSGMLVRTSIAQEVGYEEAFRWMYDDQAFCAKVCLAWPVLTSSTCIYRYRQHSASSSAVADQSGTFEVGRLAFLDWLYAYLLSKGCTDPKLWRAVRDEVWWVQHPRLGRLRQATRRARRRLAGIGRVLIKQQRASGPSDHAGDNSGDVGQVPRSGARLRTSTAESKNSVTPEKP